MTIRSTCRRIPLSSRDLALPCRSVIPISKTRSAVLGESIAGQPSNIRDEKEGDSIAQEQILLRYESFLGAPWF